MLQNEAHFLVLAAPFVPDFESRFRQNFLTNQILLSSPMDYIFCFNFNRSKLSDEFTEKLISNDVSKKPVSLSREDIVTKYQHRTNFSKTSNIVIHLRLQIFICMQSQRSL